MAIHMAAPESLVGGWVAAKVKLINIPDWYLGSYLFYIHLVALW